MHQPEGQPKNPGKPPELKPKETEEAFKARKEDYSKALADYNTANGEWNAKVKAYMAEHMALEKIKNYDGFVFANTTGDLQLPDRDGFIELITNGKAFVAMHSGGDTYHPDLKSEKPFLGYVNMLGGEFQTHKSQVEVKPILHDPAHPATRPIPAGFKVYDEIYLFKTYDKATVHALMGLDAHPNLGQTREAVEKEKSPEKKAELQKELASQEAKGYFPISWCKEFGKGKVFYTSLGHREDVWDPTWKADSPQDRKNSPEIAKIYQEHILNGIKWALGLLEAESPVGNLE